MSKTILYIVSFLALLGIASAGTVTLTGSCNAYKIGSNVIPFTLSNSGNDTAFSLILTPVVPHAKTQGVYNVSFLGPGKSATINVSISNISERGVTPAYFSLAYQQSSSLFTAVFPCLIPLRNSTVSQVLISTNTTQAQNGVANVRVKVFNAGPTSESVNVSLILPPTFSYKSSPYLILNLTPQTAGNVTFLLGFPQGYQASYSVAAAASYSSGNLSHATLNTFLITTAQAPSGSFFNSFIFYAVLIVVVVIAALIVLSLRKRKAEPVAAPEAAPTSS